MSQKRAVLLFMLLFLGFGACVLVWSLRFMPTGVCVQARQAETALVLTGRNDADTEPLELLPGEKVDINRANALQLQKLPGIGEVLAQAILDYREANGPFESPEQLMEVPGIGPGRYANLEELITIGEGDP